MKPERPISERHKAYEAAALEYNAALEQWDNAEKSLAIATARRNNAEREVSRLFAELSEGAPDVGKSSPEPRSHGGGGK